MARYCLLCKVLAIKGEFRSFHRFPAPQYQKELWCQALEKDIQKLRKWTFICSDHFPVESFVYTVNGQRFLKDDAVPMLFKGKVKRNKRTSEKLQSTIDHVTIKKECDEQELINTDLDQKIKVENAFRGNKEVSVKTDEDCEKYQPSKILVKKEDFSLTCELSEELDIKDDASSSLLELTDRIKTENKEIFKTFQMDEKILEQSGTEDILTAQNSGYFSTGHNVLLRKMFQSMYPVHTNDKMYVCLECSYKTTLRIVIRRHFLAHRYNEYTKHPEKYEKYKTFHCNECKYVSLEKYNLSRHMLKHKPKDEKGVKIYYCDCCDYSSKYRYDLMKHRVKHEPNGRKFQCPRCSFKALDQTHLKRHVGAAHRENKRYKFECKKCEYKTDCMGHLNRHLRNLHGEDNRTQKNKTVKTITS